MFRQKDHLVLSTIPFSVHSCKCQVISFLLPFKLIPLLDMFFLSQMSSWLKSYVTLQGSRNPVTLLHMAHRVWAAATTIVMLSKLWSLGQLILQNKPIELP